MDTTPTTATTTAAAAALGVGVSVDVTAATVLAILGLAIGSCRGPAPGGLDARQPPRRLREHLSPIQKSKVAFPPL